MRDARDVAERIRSLYGDDLLGAAGVVHVAAVWRDPQGAVPTLRIHAGTPRSETDFFVLNLARARADAIVTTGRILREEPELRHDLQGSAGVGEALAAWRRERLGKAEPPISLVLSSGRDLDLDHPLFHGATRALVFTGEDASERIAPDARRVGARVVGHPAPSVRAAVACLRDAHGASTIAIEAGATTARELYAEPLAVDELLLSVFEAPALPDDVRGPELVPLARIDALLEPTAAARSVEEPSGRWSFRRYRRRT